VSNSKTDESDTRTGAGHGEDVSCPEGLVASLAFAWDLLTVVASDQDLSAALNGCAQAMVQHLGAALARIWTLSDRGDALELQASAGLSTALTGARRRILPEAFAGGFGSLESVPRVALGMSDPVWCDPNWARVEGLVAWAGYPLFCQGKLVGAAALFFRKPVPESVPRAFQAAAGNLGLGIERRRRGEARERPAREYGGPKTGASVAGERFRPLIEASPNAILIVNPRGLVTFANAQAETAFGYERGELLGQAVEPLLPGSLRKARPGRRPEFPGASGTRVAGPAREPFAVRKDGSEFPVEIGRSAIETDGETSVLCTIVNITERRQAERALAQTAEELWRKNTELQAANERFRLVIEAAPNGILIVNPQGLITFANAEAEVTFGYEPGELLGQTAEMLLPKPLRASHSEMRSSFFDDHLTRPMGNGRDLSAVRKDGSVFPAEIGLRPVKTEGGTSMLCTIVDITERKLSESRMVEGVRLKSEFLANMSHEIRTPMNVLVGMSELLLDTELTADQRDYAETIRRGAESLLTVINDILDFSKIEAGKLEIDSSDFNVEETVESVTGFMAEQSSRKGLEMTCVVDSGVPHHLRGDPGRVRQVLTNLVGNAIKFTASGEINVRVHVAGEPEGRTVLRFEVQDTGIGIAQEVRSRLFQSFSQADGSNTRKYGGTGLGLAISKRLVELMGGSIDMESEFGQGSTFWFEIPFQPAEDSTPPKPDPPDRLAGIRVLVVDDSQTNRRIMAKQLASWQMVPDLAENGVEALSLVRHAAAQGQPYGLILLDHGMPGMNGLNVARIILSDPSIASTPLIWMTSYSERKYTDEAKKAGVEVYLLKPVRKALLHNTVQQALGHLSEHVESAMLSPIKADSGSAPILLVEDNPDNQKLATRLLQKYGYRCEIASNGREALDMMANSLYPLVLMDCQMPEMDGFQATRAIREREGTTRRTPIVAMTAYSMRGDRERCLQAGMDDYLSKPVDEKLLVAALQRWTTAGQPLPKAGMAAKAVTGAASPPAPSGGRLRVQAKAGLEDLIPDYLSNRQKDIQKIAGALENGELDKVRVIGHGMKGSGGGYGFPEISEIGRRIERAATERDITESGKQVAQLRDYLARLEVIYL
jgi:two-component system sensor histidine kinase/response regulator